MSAPLETWQVGPWNRWAYQHVDEMVPTVVVSRGDGPVLELPERPAALDVGDFLDTQYVDGLAVLHDGALVLEEYRNEMGADTLHLSQSVGKSVLGLLAGVLHAAAARPGVARRRARARGRRERLRRRHRAAPARHDRGDRLRRGLRGGLLEVRRRVRVAPAGARRGRRDDPRLPADDRPRRVGARRAPALLDAEHRPAGPRRRARGRRAAGRADRARAVGAARRRARRAADGRHARAPPRSAAASAPRCATTRGSASSCAATAPTSCPPTGSRGSASATTARSPAAPGPRPARPATASSGGGSAAAPAARGIHGQLVAVDRDAGVVVAILSSWPDGDRRRARGGAARARRRRLRAPRLGLLQLLLAGVHRRRIDAEHARDDRAARRSRPPASRGRS